nr:MAG TPA: hypothetical protein [Crassvirales sp.]
MVVATFLRLFVCCIACCFSLFYQTIFIHWMVIFGRFLCCLVWCFLAFESYKKGSVQPFQIIHYLLALWLFWLVTKEACDYACVGDLFTTIDEPVTHAILHGFRIIDLNNGYRGVSKVIRYLTSSSVYVDVTPVLFKDKRSHVVSTNGVLCLEGAFEYSEVLCYLFAIAEGEHFQGLPESNSRLWLVSASIEGASVCRLDSYT